MNKYGLEQRINKSRTKDGHAVIFDFQSSWFRGLFKALLQVLSYRNLYIMADLVRYLKRLDHI
jgi:hypothetical protein